jgi:hypothetical protein
MIRFAIGQTYNNQVIYSQQSDQNCATRGCNVLTRREKALNELGLLYTIPQRTTSYSRQNTPGSQFDLNQFFLGKPYWRKTKVNEQPKLKKIILNYWQALTDDSYEIVKNLWKLITDENFEIYIYSKSGQLIRVRYSTWDHRIASYNETSKISLNDIQLLPNDILQEQLSAQSINTNEYYLLDHIQIRKLILKYNKLNTPYENAHTDKMINTIFNEDTITISPQNSELFEILRTTNFLKQFKKLRLSFIANKNRYEFIWRNNFTQLEQKNLLASLNDRKTDFIGKPFSLNNLFHAYLNINTKIQPTDINLSLLSESEINLLTQGRAHTYSLDFLQQVEELEENFAGLNVEKLKKLRHLKIIADTLPEITGLENCQYMEEISLDGAINEDMQKYLTKDVIKLIKTLDSGRQNLKLSTLNSLYLLYKVPSHIENITISKKEEIYNFSLHTELKSLTLHLSYMESIKEIIGLDKCINLDEITIAGDLTDNESLTTLIQAIQSLPHLKKLTIRNVGTLNLLDLQGLPKLEELKIQSCSDLANLAGLQHCSNLRSISIFGCPISSLNLSGLAMLTSLTIRQCYSLKEIPGIEECTNLFFQFIDGGGRQLPVDVFNSITSSIPLHTQFVYPYTSPAIWEDDKLSPPSIYNIRPYHGPALIDPNAQGTNESITDDKLKLDPKDLLNKKFKKTDIKDEKSNISDETFLDKKSNMSDETFLNDKSKNINKVKLDAATKTDPSYTLDARELFIGANDTSLPIPKAYYRLNILDQITLDSKNNVIFSKQINTDFKEYQLPIQRDNKDNTYHAALTSWTLFPGEKYKLNSLSKEDILLSISNQDKIDIQHSDSSGEYVIMLKKDQTLPISNLSYIIKKDPANFIEEMGNNTVASNIQPPALPKLLNDKLQALFKKYENKYTLYGHSDFHKMVLKIKKSSQPTEKLKAIIEYCKAFKNEELSALSSNQLDNFITIIEEGKGACRHRSQSFLALCQFFKIPARMIENDLHVFIEILVSTSQGNQWKSINLGGHASKIHLTSNDELLTRSHYYAALLPDTQWQLECHKVDDVIENLLKQKKSPLIRLKMPSQTSDWHAAINAYCNRKQVQSVYIDSANDLFSLLEMNKIENSTFKKTNGPLKNLLNHGKGVLLINWSSFSANERAIFKSILDTPPTLHGTPIPAQIRVIGMLEKCVKPNDIFLSRCQEIYLLPHIILPETASPKALLKQGSETSLRDEKIHEINLYHRNDWEKYLLENISIIANELTCKEGPLLACMRLGQPIVIKNAPLDNYDFHLLIQKINANEPFYFNGEQVKTKTGFKVILKENTIPSLTPAHIKFDEKPIEDANKKIYISLQNFDRLFLSREITSDGKIFINTTGILSQYKQGQQIIFESQLTQDDKDYLYDEIEKLKKINPQLPDFHFYVSSNNEIKTTVETKIESVQELKSPNINIKIETNDPLLLVHQLRANKDEKSDLKKVPDDCIFHTSIENNWATLFEDVTISQRDSKLQGIRKESPLWAKLKSGKTVILCGTLQTEEYEAIKSLFYPAPYLDINGKLDYNIPGKLIWISQPQPELKPHSGLVLKLQTTIESYEKQLKADYYILLPSLLKKISKFFTLLGHFKNTNPNYPSVEQMTYDKYKSIYQYVLLNTDNDNPIKPIFQYYFDKKTPQYAYLNTISKYLFATSENVYLRIEKLNKILSTSETVTKLNFWQIANCFSGAALKKIFNGIPIADFDHNGVPTPTDQMINALNNSINKIPHKLSSHNRHYIQQNRFNTALRDPKKPFILLLGESGTGKTFSAKNLIKTNLFVGKDKILNWLQTKDPTNPIVLLLDEANLEISGKWEFLRGLTESPPVITYEGKTYPLTSQHKVVFTGNPLNYPGRNWQPVFWEKSHVIWFGALQKSFIREKAREFLETNESSTVYKHLNNHTGYYAKISHIIAESYQYLMDNANYLYEVTLRDVHNICARFKLTEKNITKAIYEEMSGVLLNEDAKNKFKNFLSQFDSPVTVPTQVMLPTDIVIAPTYQPAWSELVDDILLREQRIKSGTNSYGKLGLLLEGPSGVGKSTMLTKLTDMLGYSFNSAETQKKIYQITTGSLNVKETLLKAFHEGSIVILDELNLDQEIETLLNQLMSGVDLEDKPAKKPGFMVLATQNPSHNEGVIENSKALINRFHKISLPEFSDSDIVYIAKQLFNFDPDTFQRVYRLAQKDFPHVNARNMFEALKRKPITAKANLLPSSHNNGLFKTFHLDANEFDSKHSEREDSRLYPNKRKHA